MGWLDALDDRAAKWRTPARWAYLAVKWTLVALGGFAVIRLSLDRTGIWPLY